MGKFGLVVLLLLCFADCRAGTDTLTVGTNDITLINRRYFTEIEDPKATLTIGSVLKSKAFTECKADLPALKLSNSVLWLKMVIRNRTNQPYIPITINSGIINHFDLYYVTNNRHLTIHIASQSLNSDESFLTPQANVINCVILPDSSRAIYLRIQSNAPDVVPVEFNSADRYWENLNTQNTTFGIFVGIALIMILYNFLLYFIVNDVSYLYYVVYVIFFGISQTLNRGYWHKFADAETLSNYIVPVSRMLFWLSVMLFVNSFLQLRKQHPSIFRYFIVLIGFTVLPLPFILLHQPNVVYTLLTVSATVLCLALLTIGFILYGRGLKHAKFFIFAWGLFFVSVLITIARNKDLLPYNGFTSNAVIYSAILEMLLFSVALADKINFYRYQNSQSQALALRIARENERLITEQNISLEARVLERTKEVLESNKNLLNLVENLKSAQHQLIETEKMASLGQLTAGIAHEINNPINFVRSNIKPLKLDFNDLFTLIEKYTEIEQAASQVEPFAQAMAFKSKIDLPFLKQEINELLEGIEEGASRTAEIIQSLKIFSRTDEVELKPADINKSILNTLVLLRNTIPYYIEITPVFDKLSPLNCYPGKLSQVFMNILHNSIQAIIEKPEHHRERILIETKDYPDNITIEISDTGVGMPEEVRQRIFDPFFTTKDVGEGTGLGLSIVFGIIEKHKGVIEVRSAPGQGTTFIIMLPKTL